jgi:hypothetical protein
MSSFEMFIPLKTQKYPYFTYDKDVKTIGIHLRDGEYLESKPIYQNNKERISVNLDKEGNVLDIGILLLQNHDKEI